MNDSQSKGVLSESLWIPVGNSEKTPDELHVRRFWLENRSENRDQKEPLRLPVLMVHGAIENGRIFYSDSGKGLAPFLASHGFDVYVADFRGRGLSRPTISRQSRFGQTESIIEDIPALYEMVRSRHPNTPQIWVAHSWGGVLFLSAFARMTLSPKEVCKMVFFGTKRSIRVQNLDKWIKINFFWYFFARVLVWIYGYLPAKEWQVGSDNETNRSHLQSKKWVIPSAWIDSQDHFDYGQALKNLNIPPILYLAGDQDRCLGHPHDVRDLIQEVGSSKAEFKLLPGYGHVDMLTRRKAVEDHFGFVLNWLRTL